ncbi:pre-mRNA-splicing factor CWC25 homolog [Styela clava]
MTAENNLKWMYEGKKSSIDHEQYLLGKKITSIADDAEDKGDFIVKQQSSISTGNVSVLEKLDYESKVREDPLFQIRKNDYEHRKELMSNPLKKKRIQNMLKNALERDLGKRLLKSRTSSTSCSSSASDSSETDSSSDSDMELDKKISSRSLKNEKLRIALKRQLESDLEGKKSKRYDSDNEKKSRKNYENSPNHSGEKYNNLKTRRKRSSSDELKKSELRSRKNKHRERKEDMRHKSPGKGSPESVRKPGYGLMFVKDGERSSGSKPKRRRERRTPTPEPEKQKYVRKQKSGFSRKLTQEELERKRKEMMSNATWRDDQRKHNIKKYAQEEKRERDQEEKVHEMKRKAEKKGGKAKDFLHEMKLHSASVGSLEDTVRRKKHTLARKL